MSDSEEVPLETLNETSPYYKFLSKTEKFTPDETNNYQTFEDYFHNEKKIISNKIYDEEDEDKDADKDTDKYADTMVITFGKDFFNIEISEQLKYNSLDYDLFTPFSQEDIKRKRDTGEKTQTTTKAEIHTQKKLSTEELKRAQSNAATQEYNSGGNYLARGGGPLVRRISASINDVRARQTREGNPNFNLHRYFFLIIWEHFAPNSSIGERPRRYNTRPLNVRLPPIYRNGNIVCSVLLRCVTRDNREAGTTNIAYSVLFEFTNHIHWSIFYSFDVHTHGGAPIVGSGQVSELHFTLNECRPPLEPIAITKTRMFFEYTDHINNLISSAFTADNPHSVQQQATIIKIVSELMLLTMYQLATAKSYATGALISYAALNMRQNIDLVGNYVSNDNELLNIARKHVNFIDCIEAEFRQNHSIQIFTPDGFIDHLKTDINRAITLARPGGGKNINRYLTKINNIKEKLKLLKKNKVKNKVKITKLSKSIEELKAKLKKQKEKEKAKLKKQKEKEKAKLKKQKEKDKASKKKKT